MPKVTLLGKGRGSFQVMGFGRPYVFVAGVPQIVPVSMAVALAKKVDVRKKPIFKVEDMPEVIEPVKQNVHSAKPVNQITQPRLVEPWPSA